MRRLPLLTRALIVGAALAGVVACGTKVKPLHEGRVEVGLTTTTSTDPCETARATERAISEASLTAGRADAAAQETLLDQLDSLAAAAPASVRDAVTDIRETFEAVYAGSSSDGDPFEAVDYANGIQVVRRWVESGCSSPS